MGIVVYPSNEDKNKLNKEFKESQAEMKKKREKRIYVEELIKEKARLRALKGYKTKDES